MDDGSNLPVRPILAAVYNGRVRYVIDGYNLAHQITLPAGRVSPARLDAARTELLALIAKSHGNDVGLVTVVFDTKRSRKVEPTQIINGIDVRFAIGEEADDLIERLIQAHSSPRQLTVVSDDRRIQSAGHRRGCRVVGCQSYLDELDRMRLPSRQKQVADEKPNDVDAAEADKWLAEFEEPESKPSKTRHTDPKPTTRRFRRR